MMEWNSRRHWITPLLLRLPNIMRTLRPDVKGFFKEKEFLRAGVGMRHNAGCVGNDEGRMKNDESILNEGMTNEEAGWMAVEGFGAIVIGAAMRADGQSVGFGEEKRGSNSQTSFYQL
jgi:hypothetical protein